jgi:hypothetical protein
VIRKEIRDRLGLGPGWKAMQRIVDDHVELHFIPPSHNRSLGGILKPFIDPDLAPLTDDELDDAIELAVGEACRQEEEELLGERGASESADQAR